MVYIYPKFSKREVFGLRLGGPGLGNLLFIWSRAIVLSHEHNLKMVWPTWPSLKIGPWIRREKDKRLYLDLFSNNGIDIDKIRKYYLLMTKKKCTVNDLGTGIQEGMIIYDTLQMNFDGLIEYRSLIITTIMDHLNPKNRAAADFDAENALNVHIRLGDFVNDNQKLKKGANNTRIPISWYVHMVNKVRAIAGDIPVNVFSDGTKEEISELVEMNNVKLISMGNSISDILALSKSPIIISSGSSFSMWARFIGGKNCIAYPNQIKDRFLDEGTGFEIEMSDEDDFPVEIVKQIKDLYR